MIGGIRGGRIEFVEGGRSTVIGESSGALHATVTLHSPRFWRRMLRGSTGLAESYIRGEWDCDDLVALATIVGSNMSRMDTMRRRFQFIIGPLQRLGLMMPRNTRTRGRKQISAHYDLGNELFSTFLDSSMNYSAACFDDPEQDLESAQVNKMNRIADQLDAGPETHVLEIGTGWGGLAIHLVEMTGCRVSTTTISREQAALARERIRTAGLEDRIEVLEIDYRDLRGSYDRIVSIEMIEAVGWQDFPTYFRKCSGLLKPDGAMFLQAIVTDDDAYELEKASRSFISRYIFPGGCLPSVAEIRRCLRAETDLAEVWLADIGLDYARTLAIWRKRFLAATGRLGALGFDESFRRLWLLYLTVAEGGFRSRRNSDVQMLMAKPAFGDKSGRTVESGRATT